MERNDRSCFCPAHCFIHGSKPETQPNFLHQFTNLRLRDCTNNEILYVENLVEMQQYDAHPAPEVPLLLQALAGRPTKNVPY